MNNAVYSLKDIAVTVTLDGQEAITFQGFATRVSVNKSGCPAFPKANVNLKGLSLETMEKLTHLAFRSFSLKRNKIRIQAGEKGQSLPTIFQGEITNAWADFNAAPSPDFKIEARCGLFPALIPQAPISVKGTQSVSDIMQTLSKEAGYVLENNGITSSIKDCVINGDPITKMRKIAETVGANLILDDDRVVILPKQSSRKETGTIPLVNAENGMIGYPTFSNNGISFSCFFRPDLRIGANVKIESIVPRATGTWKIVSLKHDLSANDPGGQSWKTSVEAIYPRW